MGIMDRHSNLRTPHINFNASHPTMSPGLVPIYTLGRLSIEPYNNPDDGDGVSF
jgi:hypothetical protein